MNSNKKYYDLLLTTLITVVSLIFSNNANAQFTITENFRGSNVANNIVLGGEPTAYLTSGVNDPINNGWLRLTNDLTNQKGYAYIDTSFPSTLGVYIDFEYKIWRSRNDNTYHGADGISLFLFDADVKEFRAGGFGGSLGYANHASTPGMAGAYLGIGIDEFGNFATRDDNKTGGVNKLQPNSITLRGTAANNWNYLTHKSLGASASENGINSVDYNTRTANRPVDDTFYRRVKIYIDPIGTTTSPKYRIRALWRTSVNGSDSELIVYETSDPIPQKLKLGFAASTGGGFNYHEIRNLLITTPGGFRVTKSVDKANAIVGDDLTYTVNVYNETSSPVTNLVLTDSLKLSNGSVLSPDDFEITGITFYNNGNNGNTAERFTSGVTKTTEISNPFSAKLNMAANSEAYFIITGKIKRVPSGGILINSAAIDPSRTGVSDSDLTNNYSAVSTTVLNPNTDLKIEKSVDNNGIAKSDGNRFTILVSNVSNNIKAFDQTVTVRDTIPQGLTVTTINATGWSVNNSGNSYTFTRTDELKSLYSYPPIYIEVKSEVGGSWTNRATVSYQYDTDPSNNYSSADLRWVNYWHGTIDNDWSKTGNWTAGYLPKQGENVEFATQANNPFAEGVSGSGTAARDLHLDSDRVIGNFTNNSDKDLIITTDNKLVINGRVIDSNHDAGTIVVKSVNITTNKVEPTGTLLFANPQQNLNVTATVEFYNQAYKCADCGFFRNSWQYFGIPVKTAPFPYLTKSETVKQWVEQYNGDKWRPAPFQPDTELKAFKGYQITRSTSEEPNLEPYNNNSLHSFSGDLNVGNAIINITRTDYVNYKGVNLIGNSFTAAIPISSDAISFPTGVDQTIYLFNTGTRDQWRRLNGTAVNKEGYRSGQYLAIPVNLGGQDAFPDRIPSMHSFMVKADSGTGDISIDYSKLTKNERVNLGDGFTKIVTRSTNSSTQLLPSIVIDLLGEESADRLWVFIKPDANYGFDNGWDGVKLIESNISQISVEDKSSNQNYQVATVPAFNNISIGFNADVDGEYIIEFKTSVNFNNQELYLFDNMTGKQTQISNGNSYTFHSQKGSFPSRFRLVESVKNKPTITVNNKTIIINNTTSNSCSVLISNTAGESKHQLEISPNSKSTVQMQAEGTYIVRMQNAVLHDIMKVLVD